MNDPVIERIAREDPAVSSRPDTADVLLARLWREIDGSKPESTRISLGRWFGRVAAPAAAALVAVAVSVAALGVLGHRSRPSHPAAHPAHPVSVVAVGSVHVAAGTETLIAHGGSLWIAGAHSLQRLNPDSGAVEVKVRVPTEGVAAGLTFGAGSVWVASGGANTGSAATLARIDPGDGQILALINVTQSSPRHLRVLGSGIAFAADRVWISRDSTVPHGAVVAVDPATNRVDGTPVSVGTGPRSLLAAFGSLWVDDTGLTVGIKPAPALPASVARIGPGTRQVTSEPFSGAPSAGFGSLWIRHNNTITRYDPSTSRPTASILVPHVIALAFGDGRVWAVSGPTDTPNPNAPPALLTQIDPQSNRIVGRPIHLHAPLPVGIAVTGRDLWIADYQIGLLHFRLSSRAAARANVSPS
jgi:hypothetical protein